MEFKKMSPRDIILVSFAVILLFITFMMHHRAQSHEIPSDQIPNASVLPAVVKPLAAEHETFMTPHEKTKPLNRLEMDNGDEAAKKEFKEQMDADRNQQRQIKILKMELEQVHLQLENEKAKAEINKLKKEDAAYVKDSNVQDSSGFPRIKVVYIGGTETQKEAILAIDGTSYSVKENDKPIEHAEILGITNNSVKVHFSAPQELTTVIKYVQD
jgi:sRNA-binding carbon storage regulator CsrA